VASDTVKSPHMMIVPNVVYHHIFPVCYCHVLSIEPISMCLVTSFLRRTELLEQVCSSYKL
jgi:hypothetical protein